MPEQSISPVLMADIAGTSLTPEDRELLEHPGLGGLILFRRNYRDHARLCALLEQVRRLRPELLVAVDQEGGRVQRFAEGFTRLPPMAALGRWHDREPRAALRGARQLGALMASELLECGVDISFAPVLDLDYGTSAVIGDRSFHADPQVVALLAEAWVDGMHDAGMAATGKHFPGHGYAAEDSHHELPQDSRSLDEIRAMDLVPFRRLAASLDGIMPAHLRYPRVDELPAGFSRYWLEEVLRGELGFEGVIFSDDLAMAGAAVAGDYAARAAAALDAGCDMVLVCNDRPGALEVLSFLEQAPHGARVAASRLRGRASVVPDRDAARELARRLCESRGEGSD